MFGLEGRCSTHLSYGRERWTADRSRLDSPQPTPLALVSLDYFDGHGPAIGLTLTTRNSGMSILLLSDPEMSG
jgi:hypothetical protein